MSIIEELGDDNFQGINKVQSHTVVLHLEIDTGVFPDLSVA
jgi:hypothetical protein